MAKNIRWAIVGLGHIGIRHLEEIHANPNAEIVAICDIKDKDTLLLKKEYLNIPFFRNIDEFIETNIDIDIVSICVPNGLHYKIAHKILESPRLKSLVKLLIEKPIVLSNEDAKALESIESAENKIFTVLQNRYTPICRYLKDILKNNKLGNIYSVDLQCYWNRDERYYKKDSWHGTLDLDGGTLFTQYSHFIDLLLYLFGDIEVLNAKFSNNNHKGMIDFEDSGVIDGKIISGGDLRIVYSTSVFNKNIGVSMTILAENGAIKLGGAFLNVLEHFEVKGVEKPSFYISNEGNQYGEYSGSARNHGEMISNIVRYMQGDSTAEIAKVYDGTKVVRLINEMYKFRNLNKLK